VWVIKCLSFFLVPSRSPAHPSTPKCCEPGSVPQIFYSFVGSPQTHIWVYQGAWERLTFPLGFLNAKAMFKVIVYICNYESFKSLLTIMCKSTFVTKNWFEFGQCMARLVEVPSLSTTLLSILLLVFVYLFPCKMGTNVCVKILGNKKLSTLMECPDSFFSKDQ
jgi:hypothetical protein